MQAIGIIRNYVIQMKSQHEKSQDTKSDNASPTILPVGIFGHDEMKHKCKK